MSQPLDQAILDMIRATPVGPMPDRPVNDILRDMGLPPLPDLPPMPPLPGMPPLPVIDVAAMARPLTDLAGGFGTGQLGSGPTVDPAQVLSQVSSVIQTAIQLGSTALQLASSLWQGAAADAAAGKATQVGADSAAVAAQSTQTSAGAAAAAGTVFRGTTLMSGIIAKYLTSMLAAAPFLVTPPGQAFAVAMSAETLTEALAVVAETRAELTVHSAAMTTTGTKVPVTNAPTGVDPAQMVSQLAQILPSLANAATTGVKAISEAMAPSAARTNRTGDPEGADYRGPHGFPGIGGIAGGTLAGGTTASGATPRPLTAWTSPTATNTSGTTTPGTAASPIGSPAGGRGGATTPGFMPTGAGSAAGAPRGAGDASATGSVHTNLVTEQNGQEVVGEVEGTSPPVIGAADPRHTEPPDKALIL
ncbi:hypothetical protein OG563_07305 [Nocardia vinacea]|uniref:PPE family protein n=1 Tax=Nocardia vinacea TaxID=96468 RepID=A0ABZ1YXP8_9NOCA|nr:hypothetical protein [Nocardia vinacea]